MSVNQKVYVPTKMHNTTVAMLVNTIQKKKKQQKIRWENRNL